MATKTDLVRLVNISGDKFTDNEGKEIDPKKEPINFTHDGTPYVVKDSINVRRFVAEHGIKKSFSMAEGRHRLKIVELPYAQRNPEEMPVITEELSKLKDENVKLVADAIDLRKENETLKKELSEKTEALNAANAEINKLQKRK